MNKKYEAVFILDESKFVSAGGVDDFVNEFSLRVTEFGGILLRCNVLGNRKFVRRLKKHYSGFYVHFVFTFNDGSTVIALNDKYKLDDRVIRKMFVVSKRIDDKVESSDFSSTNNEINSNNKID